MPSLLKKTRKGKNRAVAQRSVAKVTTTVVQQSSRSRRRPRRQNQLSSVIQAYVDTCNDPFDCPPVKLGYGTVGQTILCSSPVHAVIDSTANGNIMLLLAPMLGKGFQYATPVAFGSTPAWADISSNSALYIRLNGEQGRIISGGIRAVPLAASTSAPGVTYATVVSGVPYSTYSTYSINDWQASPSTHTYVSSSGITGHTFPINEAAVDFSSNTIISGGSTSAVLNSNSVVICITGLPANTKVIVEGILNVEVLAGGVGNSAFTLSGETNWADDVSVAYPTPGQLYRHIFPLLDPIITASYTEEARNRVSKNRLSNPVTLGMHASLNRMFNTLASRERELDRSDGSTHHSTDAFGYGPTRRRDDEDDSSGGLTSTRTQDQSSSSTHSSHSTSVPSNAGAFVKSKIESLARGAAEDYYHAYAHTHPSEHSMTAEIARRIASTPTGRVVSAVVDMVGNMRQDGA